MELVDRPGPSSLTSHLLPHVRTGIVDGRIVNPPRRPELNMMDVLAEFYLYQLMAPVAANVLDARSKAYNAHTSEQQPPIGLFKFVERLLRHQSEFLEKTNPQVLWLLAHLVADELAMSKSPVRARDEGLPPPPRWVDRAWTGDSATRTLRQAGDPALNDGNPPRGLSLGGFARAAESLFKDGRYWESEYGGEPWARAAQKLQTYSDPREGEPSTWLDGIFQLQHNNGFIFKDKDGAVWEPELGLALLEWRKMTTISPSDFLKLVDLADPGALSHPETSSLHIPFHLRKLVRDGIVLGCWGEANPPPELVAQAHRLAPIADVFDDALAQAKHGLPAWKALQHPLTTALQEQQGRVFAAIAAVEEKLVGSTPTEEFLAALKVIEESFIGPTDLKTQLEALRASGGVGDCSVELRQRLAESLHEYMLDNYEKKGNSGRLLRNLDAVAHAIRIDIALADFLKAYPRGSAPSGEAVSRALHRVIESLDITEIVPTQVTYPDVTPTQGKAIVEKLWDAAEAYRKDPLQPQAQGDFEDQLMDAWQLAGAGE